MYKVLSQAILPKGGISLEKKIIHYGLVTGTANGVEMQMESYINKGYQPYGSPCCCLEKDGNIVICQAIVQYEK